MTKKPFVITTLWAYVAVAPNGDEGIVAVAKDGGPMVPLILADLDRIKTWAPYARDIAKKNAQTVRLVRFNDRTVLEEIYP
jgi:hypothetical protein